MKPGEHLSQEDILHVYLELSDEQIRHQLLSIAARRFPEPGQRQVPFKEVETLLCYGLFYLLDPHRYGGGNIDRVPPVVKTLSTFFRRSAGSIMSKMLNLDGSRAHSGRDEPLLFAMLSASGPARYLALYTNIIAVARACAIDERTLPDFLCDVSERDDLLGQDDIPISSTQLLEDRESDLKELDVTFQLGDMLTEKLVERKARLAQHRFALAVLQNCGRRCVFCGFEPHSLPGQSGLLRASHIKPWAYSSSHERVDVRNGLAACPIHDAAFDQGYLMVNGGYRIHRAAVLQQSIHDDSGVAHYFGDILQSCLLLPPEAKFPASKYLMYHREHLFRG